MKEKVRDIWLDVLRCIAIVMIVFMHSPSPDCSLPSFVMTGISYLTAPGIGLFFMISGALLIGKDVSTRSFFSKRFSKIVIPTLFWTIFYLSLGWIFHPKPFIDVLQSLLSIPFSRQGHGVLWFMYTLAGLYLLTPILSRWARVATKREVEFYLALWVITLLYPYLKVILRINETNTGILYYFTGYAGYYLLGFYLSRHYRYMFYHLILALVISIITPALVYTINRNPDFYSMLWYLSFPVVSMAFFWFVAIRRISFTCVRGFELVSKLSFGVFFVHIFFIQKILWGISYINSLSDGIELLLTGFLAFVLSLCFTWLISKLPFSKYIIGV